ncbi:hypothetical protein VOLCADRAFT_98073 [Volvox carteri f. nagariensis]|uniref:Uncharacterized protein n=1 Tax=Volvox carteri f. nagariensis TaxID=3068 RepID=D8UED4_VOLCA|nr:uncharacterized protein VOLCADRAFT_98073 [Volvox carteri f. nagariensis]EFJ41986.1 hypothetical protein VOLCADRAFT_98073 [Volvox carteri f. nagariensis]|eukprot:XP_002957023.1 hypothetical protein VOLCADRAFT_98073 [Volvox carteri f. nagariensis]
MLFGNFEEKCQHSTSSLVWQALGGKGRGGHEKPIQAQHSPIPRLHSAIRIPPASPPEQFKISTDQFFCQNKIQANSATELFPNSSPDPTLLAVDPRVSLWTKLWDLDVPVNADIRDIMQVDDQRGLAKAIFEMFHSRHEHLVT